VEFEQLQFGDTPDGYSLVLHRQRSGWRVVVRTYDPLAGHWLVELDLEALSWADACEAAYTALWGFKPGAPSD